MQITERQKGILDSIIQEYINSAKPVSSQLLEKKDKLKVCPATIRIEMQKLTEAGFIFQPHTSAGRVPTDKGYRFFVDSLLEKSFSRENFDSTVEKWIIQDMKDIFKFLQLLTKNLAAFSSNLALAYLSNEKILWKDGWEEILQEPEFKETELILKLAKLTESFEKEIKNMEVVSGLEVYIGRENPFSKAGDFSTIITRCCFPRKKQGFLAIVGPKRMAYDKNINSLNSLTRLLERL